MSYRKRHKIRYIPEIAKKSQRYDNDNIHEVKEPDDNPDRPVKPTGQLTADFVKLKKVDPPAIHYNRDNKAGAIAGYTNELDRHMINPFINRPRSNRRSNINSNSAMERIIRERNKMAIKKQEKELTDTWIKPLTDKGIKVNKVKYVYPGH